MVLIYPGKSLCALCTNAIKSGDEFVNATNLVDDESDPLYPFSREAMHKDCFLNWEMRPAFIARVNSVLRAMVRKDGAYWQLDENGTIVRHQLDS